MPLETLSLETLTELDPTAAALFAKHLQRAAYDVYDRPLDKKTRKVSLEVEITPDPDSSGLCDRALVQVFVRSKVPDHCTRATVAALKPSGALLFNPDSPDNVAQETMFKKGGEE